jgi:6-phosphofructokinase 1
MKRIAILTGGGDVPGLNAAIKAFVGRLLEHEGYEVLGLRRGWASLINILRSASWSTSPHISCRSRASRTSAVATT